MNAKERLILALDVKNIDQAKQIIEELDNSIVFYKVGLQLFTKEGYKIIDLLKKCNKKIFLDLKFHDIPNTVTNAVQNAIDMDIDMLTVHSTGGFQMMESIAKLIWQHRDNGKKTPIVLAVTLLTSLDSAFLEDIIGATNRTLDEEVLILAKAVKSAGLNGVVASAKEVKKIKQEIGNDFIVLTPGIRPKGFESSDQKRIATPFEAIKDGSDYLVVGRPILQSENKKQTVEQILKEMEEGFNG